MKVYNIIYHIQRFERKITIVDNDFVNKYKYKCKMVINNKSYSLQSDFEINSFKDLKIKFICYTNIPDISIIFANYLKPSYEYYEIYIRKKRINTYGQNLKCLYYRMPKMIYENEPEIKDKDYQRISKNFASLAQFPIDSVDEFKKRFKNELNLSKKIRVFGKNFVTNNKDKCIIVYNNKLFPLREYFFSEEIEKKDDKLEIFLIELKKISNFSCMFSKCKLLEKLELFNNDEENIKPEQKDIDPENSNKFKKFYFNTGDIKSDGGYFFDIFNNYSSITFIPSPNLNSINTSINNLFYEFPSFLTDMSYMFYNCSSLISLPDISNWNTENVENMSYI